MTGHLCSHLHFYRDVEPLAQIGIGRSQRLAGVERLGADFASVIDPHQS